MYAINALLEECEGENGLVNDHVRGMKNDLMIVGRELGSSL